MTKSIMWGTGKDPRMVAKEERLLCRREERMLGKKGDEGVSMSLSKVRGSMRDITGRADPWSPPCRDHRAPLIFQSRLIPPGNLVYTGLFNRIDHSTEQP